jgi:4a-hydroxytetrahydrobiopterin dehydratase
MTDPDNRMYAKLTLCLIATALLAALIHRPLQAEGSAVLHLKHTPQSLAQRPVPAVPQPSRQHSSMPRLLTEPEIKTQAATLPGWTVEGKRLRCERVFKGFPEAVAFVQALVAPAESAGHHPDLKVSYNRVVVELTTHDAKGLTQQDFDLAKVISSLP